MVYCGKPSRSCSQCKTRQVRCDKNPECGQCRRSGLKCPGPRDSNELVFRDQTQDVTRKLVAKGSKFTIQTKPNRTILEQAHELFFGRYVDGHSRTYEYISALLSISSKRTCLSDAVDATSLAYLSSQRNCHNILRQAWEKYAVALRLVGSAIRSPDRAVQDTTLVSVLLLDLFEKVTRTQRSPESWTKHVQGAIGLAKLRGDAQFQSPLGLRLFMQLNTTILMGCAEHELRVPPDLIDIRSAASKYFEPQDPKWKFSETVVEYVNLRAAVSERGLSREEILAAAKAVDFKFSKVMEGCPSEWKYETIRPPLASKEIFGKNFHVYSHHHITHTWNNIRILRILLQEEIIKQWTKTPQSINSSPSFDDDSKHAIAEASLAIVLLSTGILASVPQYTQLPRHNTECPVNGSSEPSPSSLSSRATHSPSPTTNTEAHDPTIRKVNSKVFTAFETSRCYSLIFSLYIVGSFCGETDAMRSWTVENLEFMEAVVGIKEAGLAAGYLKRSEKINIWTLYTMIGSHSFSA